MALCTPDKNVTAPTVAFATQESEEKSDSESDFEEEDKAAGVREEKFMKMNQKLSKMTMGRMAHLATTESSDPMKATTKKQKKQPVSNSTSHAQIAQPEKNVTAAVECPNCDKKNATAAALVKT